MPSPETPNQPNRSLTEDEVRASVSAWIDGLRQGDDGSAEELWRRYFERLSAVADRKLTRSARRAYDGEDVALSAFHSLCEGVREGRFPELHSRDELWSLLIVIAARKASHRHRAERTLKRGGGVELPLDGAQFVVAPDPTPEFAAVVADETDHLIDLLGDEELKTIARGKLDGLGNDELAHQLGYTTRTVERRLALIRRTWRERGIQ
ncbi:MAG: ECF-type sigma factor [Planctomycetota bacterium]